MYYKEQRYEKAKSLTLASTYTKQLPETGLIDSILLQLRCVNHTNVAVDAPCNIHHHITKIEVIGDNDKTLFSLTGEETLAKAYRKMKTLPEMRQNEYGGKSQALDIPIFFGRQFHDGHYALDLSKWDKVEVLITNDMSSSYFTSLTLDLGLTTIEEPVEAYAKFLKQWEYQKDTASADGEYTRPKLPTKGRLRSLMIQLDPTLTATTAAVAKDPVSDNYNWKLWFKDRALTIRDHRPMDLMSFEHLQSGLGMGVSSCKPYPSTTRYTDFHWAVIQQMAMSHIKEDGADVTVGSLKDSRNRYEVMAFVGGCTFYQAMMQGIGLFHTFDIPFFVEDVEAEYLDLDRYKPVEIEWYNYGAGNTHRIILEKPIGQGPAEYE